MNKPSLWVPLRLLNTPLCISYAAGEEIMRVAEGGPEAMELYAKIQSKAEMVTEESRNGGGPDPGIAIIPVIGGLVYRGYGWFWRRTYQSIRADFRQAMTDESVKAVLFDIESSGGEGAGLMDLIDEIYTARGTKPIYAFANEYAYSAAYGIASAADQVWLPRTGGIGSVGVIGIHYEQSRLEEAVGVKFTAIYYGARKNDFSPHEPLSKEALRVAQKSIDRHGDLFVQTVARNREMKFEDVRATEAAIYDGQDAVKVGFADAIMSWDEALSRISEKTSRQGGIEMNLAEFQTALPTLLASETDKPAVVEALKAAGFVPAAELATLRTEAEKSVADARSEGEAAGIATACEIAGLCSLAGVPQMTETLLVPGATVGDAKKKLMDARSQSAEDQPPIYSRTSPTGGGERNLLVEGAQARVEANK